MIIEEEKKQRVYIAGPMRGYPQFNFPLFAAVTKLWRELGWDVVSPAEEDVKHDGVDPLQGPTSELPFSHYMHRDIQILLGVDAIAFLPAWENSRGARIEYVVGKALDLKMYDAISGRPLETTMTEERVFELERAVA